MIVDVHGHVTAPDALYVYKAGLLSHRGAHGRGKLRISDDEMIAVLNRPTFGTSQSHLELLKEVGTDMQLISARPYQLMQSEKPAKLVAWFAEETNNVIAQQCRLFPEIFRGICALPQGPGISPKNCVPELERCVKEFGFVGCLLNPDPSEATATGEIPPLGDEFWYPLYEKLVELDVPAYVHGAGCKSMRHTYSVHFILEETVAVMSLAGSRVFQDFPDLKIVVSHGGGAVPYHCGRFSAPAMKRGGDSFLEHLRRMYFDTVLYTALGLELLIKTVGVDRCVFGTERPGTATVRDQKTGKWMDDIKPIISDFGWLSEVDKRAIFEDNARALFGLNARREKPATVAV